MGSPQRGCRSVRPYNGFLARSKNCAPNGRPHENVGTWKLLEKTATLRCKCDQTRWKGSKWEVDSNGREERDEEGKKQAYNEPMCLREHIPKCERLVVLLHPPRVLF